MIEHDPEREQVARLIYNTVNFRPYGNSLFSGWDVLSHDAKDSWLNAAEAAIRYLHSPKQPPPESLTAL